MPLNSNQQKYLFHHLDEFSCQELLLRRDHGTGSGMPPKNWQDCLSWQWSWWQLRMALLMRRQVNTPHPNGVKLTKILASSFPDKPAEVLYLEVHLYSQSWSYSGHWVAKGDLQLQAASRFLSLLGLPKPHSEAETQAMLQCYQDQAPRFMCDSVDAAISIGYRHGAETFAVYRECVNELSTIPTRHGRSTSDVPSLKTYKSQNSQPD